MLFRGDNFLNAWNNLARPIYPSTKEPHRIVCCPRHPKPQSRLESLLTELLDKIYDKAQLRRKDALALGLASETLRLHLLRHIEKEVSTTKAQMAGVEIACTGSWIHDLPGPLEDHDWAIPSENVRKYGCIRKFHYLHSKKLHKVELIRVYQANIFRLNFSKRLSLFNQYGSSKLIKL